MNNIFGRDSPPIKKIKISWQYEGETDFFNSKIYNNLTTAIQELIYSTIFSKEKIKYRKGENKC